MKQSLTWRLTLACLVALGASTAQAAGDAEAGKTVAEVEAEANTAALETCDRVDLTTSFDEKDEVKSLGAKWDPNTKKWYISGDEYRQDRAKWDKWQPTPLVDQDDTVCPF